jgi:TonB family protein
MRAVRSMRPVCSRSGVALLAWLSVSVTAATPLQSPLPARENLLVLEARKVRQANAQGPVDLTLPSGKRISVPSEDVHAAATALVRRAMASQAHRAVEPARLFVLHIREVAPLRGSDVRVTLSSGTVVHVRSSDISDPRLTFLRTSLAEAHWAAIAAARATDVPVRESAKAPNPTEGAESPCSNLTDVAATGEAAKPYFQAWLKGFEAHVRRSWFIPASAMTKKGRVGLRFVVHKDGRITDTTVHEPSDVAEFNQSALSAITAANPTEPLPTEYPSERLVACVTFYFNGTLAAVAAIPSSSASRHSP